ncbi:GNAT family N-acetyltransferase [Brachybacterium saurashtrense]|uniref:N-acetyltransferase n=1 Tax=Brachybacterium saurashtrense TaxID=556288 RepID=A0A345YSA6_9MICO|nr:GNAT family N-acetyltransferase [Brachybacterium saurashtrense]AXK46808.1 N-acetyltransferase [Brachybacterium saurashtrense]RRR22523.1 N-acetyltransferase [Brachybacterium saurashtrense]
MHDGAAPPSSDGGRRAASLPGPVLTTARLVLTPVAPEDLEALFALHADPRAFVEDLTALLTERAQMEWALARWREDWRRHGAGHLAVRARERHDAPPLEPHHAQARERHGMRALQGSAGEEADAAALPPGLLGVVGLAPLEAEGRRLLSAYWRLDPALTGRGVAQEAMRAVLAHPRLGGRDEEVVAVTAGGNAPSRTLAARLGFEPAPSQRPVPGGRDGGVLLVLPAHARPAHRAGQSVGRPRTEPSRARPGAVPSRSHPDAGPSRDRP